jgi:RimJ/RimL family protein N-acetyltransferase
MQTSRLTLRKFNTEDVDELAEILSDPQVMKFSSKGPFSKEDTSNFIAWSIESYDKNGYGQWAVIERETGALIGLCGLSETDVNDESEVEIGYRIAQDRWGNGFASEAAAAALHLGFEKYRLASIIAIVSTEHAASIRVAEKIGFSDYSLDQYKGWDVRIYRKILLDNV